MMRISIRMDEGLRKEADAILQEKCRERSSCNIVPDRERSLQRTQKEKLHGA